MAEKRPIYPIHPGTVLKDELDELQVRPVELARDLHVPPNRLYQIIAGKRGMTADTALRLQRWFGISARFWMNLQGTFELECAEELHEAEIQRTVRPGKHIEYATARKARGLRSKSAIA